MTLINYLTRVHFADGVLEEALYAELGRARRTRPLLVIDPSLPGRDAAEQVLASLPKRSDAVFFRDPPRASNESDVARFVALFEETTRDCVIALGGRSTIEFARIARLAVGDRRPLAEIASPAGARTRPPPDLFVAPRLSGYAAALSAFASVRLDDGERALLTTHDLLPTVAIFDPILDLDARADESASAGAEALVSCVEPYLAAGFNPPADGIAFDGLRRALISLPRILSGGGLADRREMAAAGMNGGLAQEKGLGAAMALAKAVADLSEAAPDGGAVARLVLPGILRIGGGRARDERRIAVRDMLRLSSEDCLAEGVEAFLKPLPLPSSLADMGVGRLELHRAAETAARDLRRMRAPRTVPAEDLFAVLESVY